MRSDRPPLAALAALLLALACAGPALAQQLPYSPRHLLVLAFAGISRDGLLAAEALGKFPALSLFVREGTHFDACYAGLPSVPERALAEFLTGLAPERTVPARAWRAGGRVRGHALEDRSPFKLAGDPATIFAHFERLGIAAGSPVARGARTARFADFEALPRLVAHAGENHDRAILNEFLSCAQVPGVAVLVFSEPAYTFAREGAAGFEAAYARVDRVLAALTLYLRDRRMLDDALVALVGLPGIPARTRRTDLKGALTRAFACRVRVADGRRLGEGRHDAASSPDLILCPNGRANLVYSMTLDPSTLRSRDAPPRERVLVAPGVTLESLVATLAARPETEMVIHPAGFRRARIVTRRGESEVDWHLNGIRYDVLRGADPLELTDLPQVARGLAASVHSGAVWLRMSARGAFPGAPSLVKELFEWEGAPVALHVMKPGITLEGVDGPGTSGGLRREETLCPAILLGPNMPAGRFEVARPRDLLPTILSLLGNKPAVPLDGRALRIAR